MRVYNERGKVKTEKRQRMTHTITNHLIRRQMYGNNHGPLSGGLGVVAALVAMIRRGREWQEQVGQVICPLPSLRLLPHRHLIEDEPWAIMKVAIQVNGKEQTNELLEVSIDRTHRLR